MIRNKEFRQLLIGMLLATVVGGVISFMINPLFGIITLGLSSIFILLTMYYTYRRYHEIDRLSKYLRQIYSGDYSFDIRDNREGELSILKNEIYKVTIILSKQAEQLQLEKEQLAKALSDISHQLKTPLTSMTVMTDLLSNPTLPQEKRKEFTRNLDLQLERMEWLLTSLLKLSKIDAGTVEFKNEPVRVEALIHHALKPLLIPIELKEQKVTISGDASVTYLGDFNWTIEALINILKNCMEHTQEGGTISIQYEENPIYTEINISDNGSGIGTEDLPFIFKRFYKGKNAGEESVGIGLAMAHSIITNQNGDITVSSQIKQGTRFCIKFYKQIS
jgi:signal transduction histidine kinase